LDPEITFQVQFVTTLVDKRVAVTLKYFILINLFLFANHRGLIPLDNNRRKFVKFQRSFSGAITEYQLRQPKLIEIGFSKMVVIFSRRFQAEEDDPPVIPRQLQAEPGLEVNMADLYANSCDTDANSCDTDTNSCDTDTNSCDTDTNICDTDT
jgi:hypothetical protein